MSDELPREGSWYLNCHSCRADVHIVGHNRTAGDDRDPDFCPFCGRTNVSVEIEPATDGGTDISPSKSPNEEI